MATVLISGGTGLIGTALTNMLVAKRYDVIILSRNIPDYAKAHQNISYALWNVEEGSIDTAAVKTADYIIHLAGANIAEKRWTGKRKNEIVQSRVQSSALLVKTVCENENKVRAIIGASAIGWYGPDTPNSKQHGFTETDQQDDSFLGNTCFQWEQSLHPVESVGIRLVFIRTGIVLANEGGAYPEFKKSLRFGLAAILGGGEQVVSWIHIDDICRLYLFALENEIKGVYNGVAPAPVTNRTLILEIAKKLRPGFYIAVHVPAFILKIVLGKMSVEVLKSTTVSAQKIRSAGFRFLFPSVEAALNDLSKKTTLSG